MEADNSRLRSSVASLNNRIHTLVGPMPEEIKAYAPYVYFVMSTSLEVTLPDGMIINIDCQSEEIGWMGTGFLLSDGTFVTARHVVEPWYFWADGEGVQDTFFELNIVANNGGKVVAHFLAVSSSGDSFEFSTRQIKCNRNKDKYESFQTEKGNKKVSLAQSNENDIAYFQSNKKGGLKYDSSKSNSLKSNTNLTIIGFPHALGVKSFDRVKPLVANARVASDGLHNNMIVTTATGSEHGNSGGPVFVSDASGKLVVVGVVSAGFGKNMGLMVPISSIK